MRRAVVEIDLADINDAPILLEAANDSTDPIQSNNESPLELDRFGIADNVDGTLVSKTTLSLDRVTVRSVSCWATMACLPFQVSLRAWQKFASRSPTKRAL